jgi:hypothetical protein
MQVLSYMDATTLTAMLVAVVNQHHARLKHPLQVLALFFQVSQQSASQTNAWKADSSVVGDLTSQ